MNSNNLESLLKIPFVIDNIFKELRIKEQFENEKQIPVPNLKEFFDMTQKKEEIYVPNLKQFFELANKPIKYNNKNIKNKNNNNKVYSKSFVSNITYKNGHKYENIEEKINDNGKEKIIKKCLIDDKDENGKKYHNNYKTLFHTPLYNGLFDNFLNYEKSYKNNDLFLLPSHRFLLF
jgi:hypothetical protein